MKASQVLKDEHRGIERMLNALEKEAARIEAGQEVNVTLVDQGVDFLRNFADACHHHKEEKELFPALERAGVPVEGGPIGVMLADHEEGRKHIRSMANAVEAYKAGDTAAAATLAASARAYVELLRGHIWKEDNVLFKMADQALPDTVQEELVASFDRIETDHMGPGVHERYHQMLDELDTSDAA
jgi:hemerythrin-like domain-containing protein